MKVVVDTNVSVAGLLSPFGRPAGIVRMIASGKLVVCYDARILTEYLEVLARAKFRFDQADVQALMDQIRAAGEVVAGDPLPADLPDPNDAPFLEVALSARAESLITGNLRHFPVRRRQGMRVLTPTAFLKFYARTRRHKVRRPLQ